MKPSALFLCLWCALAQTAPPPAEPVAVVIEGKPYTSSELDMLFKAQSGQFYDGYVKNRKLFLESYALLIKLAALAEKEGLDKEYPHAQRIEQFRRQMLAEAMINRVEIRFPVKGEDQLKYYNEHRDEFAEAKVKVIYIAFNNNPIPQLGPKAPLNEVQARAKAAGLVTRIRAGADFVKMVHEHSESEDTRKVDGDFGTIKATDTQIPPAIKAAVYALKPGEITDAIQQPNGFYIFKLEELTVPEFAAVKDQIYLDMKKKMLDEWMAKTRSEIKIEFKDEAFLSGAPAKK